MDKEKCKRCGDFYTHLSGYCSIYCRDTSEHEEEVKALQIELEQLKKQLEASENKWSELANHLNPYNYKPLYWDYKTARNIIAAMKDIERGEYE